MLTIPKTTQANLSCYGTCKADEEKQKQTSPPLAAPMQTRCLAHAHHLCPALLLLRIPKQSYFNQKLELLEQRRTTRQVLIHLQPKESTISHRYMAHCCHVWWLPTTTEA